MFLKVHLLSVNGPLWVEKHSKHFNLLLYAVVEPKDPKMTQTFYFKLICLLPSLLVDFVFYEQVLFVIFCLEILIPYDLMSCTFSSSLFSIHAAFYLFIVKMLICIMFFQSSADQILGGGFIGLFNMKCCSWNNMKRMSSFDIHWKTKATCEARCAKSSKGT